MGGPGHEDEADEGCVLKVLQCRWERGRGPFAPHGEPQKGPGEPGGAREPWREERSARKTPRKQPFLPEGPREATQEKGAAFLQEDP